jgi:hypothetical protein
MSGIARITRAEALELAESMLDRQVGYSMTESGLTLARFILADEPLQKQLSDVVEKIATTDPARSDELAQLVQLAVDALALARR